MSIDSILSQTFSDFEFIIVDDCSNDATSQILGEYVRRDQRIRIIKNIRNLGLTQSLNKGLRACQGEYIARQDADDISLPERLKRQAQYLTEHPEVGVVGSWVAIIDENRQVTTIKEFPTSPALIKWTLIFRNPLAHSSVIIRRSLIETTAYKPEILYSQDYDLWVRLSEKTKFDNIPQILCLSRKHEQMISVQHRDTQRQMGNLVRRRLIENLLEDMVPDTLFSTLLSCTQKQVLEKEKEVREVIYFIERIYQRYIAKHDALNSSDKDTISMDAARRIVDIGLLHSEKYPFLTLKTILRGLLINSRVLRLLDIKVVARNIIKHLFAEAERASDEISNAPSVGVNKSYIKTI